MNNNEFHKPFLNGMIVVAIVTIVSMVFVRSLISEKHFYPQQEPVFTSSKSYSAPE